MSATIIAFERKPDPLAYAPGVAPFDRTNPAHISAWNAIHACAWADQRARERADREGR